MCQVCVWRKCGKCKRMREAYWLEQTVEERQVLSEGVQEIRAEDF